MLRPLIALLIGLLLPVQALAEKRVALLIGNQSYNGDIGALANPHNDTALLEKALKRLGFGLGGLPKDDREATRLYKLSADQGNDNAAVNLSSLKGGQ